VAGGYLGDFVKGPVPTELPVDLQNGIRLHRRIDAVSNRLPEIGRSVERFDPELRRVAPVLVDVLADHFLALAFEHHHPAAGPDRLEDFTDQAYRCIERYQQHVPAAGRFFRHMRDTDLLARYREPAVVLRAMANILQRLRGHAHLCDKLDPLLDTHFAALQRDFEDYFPALRRAVGEWHAERQKDD